MFLGNSFYSKIDQLTAFNQTEKPKRPAIQKIKISKFILTG